MTLLAGVALKFLGVLLADSSDFNFWGFLYEL